MNNKSILLSAVVITKNEETRIAKCLESLGFCDEIIVVDNGSTDKTTDIAKRYNTSIERFTETDFSALRNFGKDKSKGIWILYVDADEIITKDLEKEIFQTIDPHPQSDNVNGYYLRRQNYYLGYKWPVQDKMQRLFVKDKLIRWKGKLHETAIIDGKMGVLTNPLIHNTHRTLEEMVAKTNEWSDFEAQLRFNAHHANIAWWRLIRVMMTGFFQSFMREGGWRMGTVGWIESLYQAFSMFITYAKLWELQRDEHVKKNT
ncbi:MAG: Glycosyl transferase family 2 [Microgenomates group bacterium GW2011_GWC1_43_11]|uniref:Glycosyl transferase family 2 n=1 Tax=Candidatus Gottesmanbacteria bacterium GW2011_GWB1_44_11c TaxID=1618447 RepID=A0A0G1GWV5_9BACT|nr:MAG: Glycosyl transferase family 2 [Microgenomates group bacterium GW2011_GWC1_43_11]KKT39110.1 MAG: Glycosyl transferase family 2 [Candidatus Gottesmanbacteria bacterium GW2011_GWB1_44_11c]